MKKTPPIRTDLRFLLNRASGILLEGRRALDSLLFPWPCPGCSELLPQPDALCADCADRLPRIRAPFCERCGSPMPGFWRVKVCPDCKGARSALTRTRSCFFYEGLVREMILDAKYRRNARMLRYFSERMFLLARSEFPSRIRIATPVPLHPDREWERTFNQSALLARDLAKWWGMPLWKGLRRVRKTPAQSVLSGLARRRNLQDAFRIAGNKAVPRSVLLIDDVITTGATLEACARTLRRNGARRVYAITIARSVMRSGWK